VKFKLDANLPRALARALHELSHVDGYTVCHLIDKFPPNTPDIDWITALKEEKNWVVVSQDRFTKGRVEKQILRECGLVVFCLAKHWSGESYWNKAYQLVRWWPSIIEQSERISGGAAFEVPWRFTSPKGKFKPLNF